MKNYYLDYIAQNYTISAGECSFYDDDTDPDDGTVQEEFTVSWNILYSNERDIRPCTIVPSRYKGACAGGRWLAFPRAETKLPEGWNSEELACCHFWKEYDDFVGHGDTPQQAFDSLFDQLMKYMEKNSF